MAIVIVETAQSCAVVDASNVYATNKLMLREWILRHFNHCIPEPNDVPRTYDALVVWCSEELGVDIMPLVVE